MGEQFDLRVKINSNRKKKAEQFLRCQALFKCSQMSDLPLESWKEVPSRKRDTYSELPSSWVELGGL